MSEMIPCDSCSMPIESGPYCQYCADQNGDLRSFEETLARMMQFAISRDPKLGREEAKAQTLMFMSSRPAWKAHPEVKAAVESA